MIISDNEHMIIDVNFNKDNFLHITKFKSKPSGEWMVTTVGLSPENQSKLVDIILEKQKELVQKQKETEQLLNEKH